MKPELSSGVPYVIVAHSVGTWIAYELIRLLKQHSLPMPAHAFLSCFPAPDIPVAERPWTANGGSTLGDAAFQAECRGWDVNELLFSEKMWGLYGGLLRADFGLFDTYSFEGSGRGGHEATMGTSITAFYASSDKKITEQHVRGWERFGDSLKVSCVEGNHMFVSDQEQKAAWFQSVCADLQKQLDADAAQQSVLSVTEGDRVSQLRRE